MKIKFLFLSLALCIIHVMTGQNINISSQINIVLDKIAVGDILDGIEEIKSLSAKNDLAAQFYLGECYEYGAGMDQNYGEAFKYYRRTAERGLPDGMLKLSEFYQYGKGMPQDNERAEYWFQRYEAKGGKKRLKDFASYYNQGLNSIQNQNYALNSDEKNVEISNSGSISMMSPLPVTSISKSGSPESMSDSKNKIHENSTKENIIVSDVDIKIPVSNKKKENLFALVIANEDYSRVAPVTDAKRDGRKVKEYLNKTLGIPEDHIAYIENATLNDMRYELNRLSKIGEAYNGNCSFIIYYCGHGVPDEKDGKGYLLPVDGYGNDLATGYSLDNLYKQLGELPSEKTFLITDACFSGTNKSGGMLMEARGVALKAKPNNAEGNLIALSACEGDETAYSYEEKGHGLMTYFFLKSLQESKGQMTLGEIADYVIDNVRKTSIVKNGKTQTPNIIVSPILEDNWKEITF